MALGVMIYYNDILEERKSSSSVYWKNNEGKEIKSVEAEKVVIKVDGIVPSCLRSVTELDFSNRT